MTSTPTKEEVNQAYSLLWEASQGKLAPSDQVYFLRIANLLKRQEAEIERLRAGKVAA